MSAIAIIELASAFSFEVALIQREHPTREYYDTAWTLNVALGTACALATVGLAYPAALFYGGHGSHRSCWYSREASIVQCFFDRSGTVNFRRDMDFSREFRFLASKRVIAFVVTLSLALLMAAIGRWSSAPLSRASPASFSATRCSRSGPVSAWARVRNCSPSRAGCCSITVCRSRSGASRTSSSGACMAPERWGFTRLAGDRVLARDRTHSADQSGSVSRLRANGGGS